MVTVYAVRWVCEIVSLHSTEKRAQEDIDRRVAEGDDREDYAITEEEVDAQETTEEAKA